MVEDVLGWDVRRKLDQQTRCTDPYVERVEGLRLVELIGAQITLTGGRHAQVDERLGQLGRAQPAAGHVHRYPACRAVGNSAASMSDVPSVDALSTTISSSSGRVLRQQSPPGVGEYIREIVLCSPCPRGFCWRSANKLRKASHASTSLRRLTWCAWLRTCHRSGQPILDTTGNEHCTIPGEMCRLGEFLLRNRTRQVCGIRGVPGAARQRN